MAVGIEWSWFLDVQSFPSVKYRFYGEPRLVVGVVDGVAVVVGVALLQSRRRRVVVLEVIALSDGVAVVVVVVGQEDDIVDRPFGTLSVSGSVHEDFKLSQGVGEVGLFILFRYLVRLPTVVFPNKYWNNFRNILGDVVV